MELSYTAFADHPAIARSARIVHRGSSPLTLRRVLSCSVDFPSSLTEGRFLHLSGAHLREREVKCTPLHPGIQSIESRRGSSSHQHNPFLALMGPDANEEHGAVYGFNLVVTPFKTRGEVAFTGAFGYELDLSLLSDEDRAEVKRQTALYKQVRQVLLDGDLYRLRSPFESNEAAWMMVSPARDEALVTHVTILALPNAAQRFLRLKGLDAAANYKIGDLSRRGDALMNIGLPIPYPSGDFVSWQWHLRKIP